MNLNLILGSHMTTLTTRMRLTLPIFLANLSPSISMILITQGLIRWVLTEVESSLIYQALEKTCIKFILPASSISLIQEQVLFHIE